MLKSKIIIFVIAIILATYIAYPVINKIIHGITYTTYGSKTIALLDRIIHKSPKATYIYCIWNSSYSETEIIEQTPDGRNVTVAQTNQTNDLANSVVNEVASRATPEDRIISYNVGMFIKEAGYITAELWVYYKDGTKELISRVTKKVMIRDIDMFIKRLVQILPHEIYYQGKRVNKFVIILKGSSKSGKFAHIGIDYTTSTGKHIKGTVELYNPEIHIIGDKCTVTISTKYFSTTTKMKWKDGEGYFEITEKELDTLFASSGFSGEEDVHLTFDINVFYKLIFYIKFNGFDVSKFPAEIVKCEYQTSLDFTKDITFSIPIHVKLGSTIEKKPYKVTILVKPEIGKLEFHKNGRFWFDLPLKKGYCSGCTIDVLQNDYVLVWYVYGNYKKLLLEIKNGVAYDRVHNTKKELSIFETATFHFDVSRKELNNAINSAYSTKSTTTKEKKGVTIFLTVEVLANKREKGTLKYDVYGERGAISFETSPQNGKYLFRKTITLTLKDVQNVQFIDGEVIVNLAGKEKEKDVQIPLSNPKAYIIFDFRDVLTTTAPSKKESNMPVDTSEPKTTITINTWVQGTTQALEGVPIFVKILSKTGALKSGTYDTPITLKIGSQYFDVVVQVPMSIKTSDNRYFTITKVNYVGYYTNYKISETENKKFINIIFYSVSKSLEINVYYKQVQRVPEERLPKKSETVLFNNEGKKYFVAKDGNEGSEILPCTIEVRFIGWSETLSKLRAINPNVKMYYVLEVFDLPSKVKRALERIAENKFRFKLKGDITSKFLARVKVIIEGSKLVYTYEGTFETQPNGYIILTVTLNPDKIVNDYKTTRQKQSTIQLTENNVEGENANLVQGNETDTNIYADTGEESKTIISTEGDNVREGTEVIETGEYGRVSNYGAEKTTSEVATATYDMSMDILKIAIAIIIIAVAFLFVRI